jgi:ribosomal protein L20
MRWVIKPRRPIFKTTFSFRNPQCNNYKTAKSNPVHRFAFFYMSQKATKSKYKYYYAKVLTSNYAIDGLFFGYVIDFKPFSMIM